VAQVRDLLALILGLALGVVWVAYMLAMIWRRESPSELDWLILPTGVGALLKAIDIAAARMQRPRE
jgi:hypothetical protein